MYSKKACGYVLPYDKLSPVSKSLPAYYDLPEVSGNYNKQWAALLVIRKSAASSWVKWTHHSEGKTHCDMCLVLDGCWFLENKSPMWSHHPFCHCTLDPIDYAAVLMHAATYSEYSKFDPYYSTLTTFISMERTEPLKAGAIQLMTHGGCKPN